MTNITPSIKLRSFLQIAPYLAMRGVSSLEFFQRLGISPNIFQNPDIWIPRSVCFRIANEMVSITQDPFGGAYVGHLTEIRSLGVWGELIMNSTNIAQACTLASTNTAMLHQGEKSRLSPKVARQNLFINSQGNMRPIRGNSFSGVWPCSEKCLSCPASLPQYACTSNPQEKGEMMRSKSA